LLEYAGVQRFPSRVKTRIYTSRKRVMQK
jgi:hypothetical protein